MTTITPEQSILHRSSPSTERSPMPTDALAPQTIAQIDLGAVRRNFERFTHAFASETNFICAVKKNAYGHGSIEVARVLHDSPKLAGYGVATLLEGIKLRDAGITKPVIIFAVLRGAELYEAIRADLTLTMTTAREVREADAMARSLDRQASVHFKVDTGLGRLGLDPVHAAEDVQTLFSSPNLALNSVYTHFSNAWLDPEGAERQLKELEAFHAAAGLGNLPAHIGGSNSLALRDAISRSPLKLTIRSGIATYGYHPGVQGLEAAMTLKSRIIYRRTAPKGSRISYAGLRVLDRDSELAIVGAGYGNGYPWRTSNKGDVLIRGRRFPIMGRVCMDQVIVDVTSMPEVEVGENAVLFGTCDEGVTLPVAEVAALAETIPYEVLCIAGAVNPRVYRDS